jgi:hypothetical protein
MGTSVDSATVVASETFWGTSAVILHTRMSTDGMVKLDDPPTATVTGSHEIGLGRLIESGITSA